MVPFYLDCNLVSVPPEQLGQAVQTIFQQLEDQSQNTDSFTNTSGSITAQQHGAQTDSSLHAVADTQDAGFMTSAFVTQLQHYQGDTTAAAPASTAQYPNDGDWGFHTDTSGSTYSLAKNKSGTIYIVALT